MRVEHHFLIVARRAVATAAAETPVPISTHKRQLLFPLVLGCLAVALAVAVAVIAMFNNHWHNMWHTRTLTFVLAACVSASPIAIVFRLRYARRARSSSFRANWLCSCNEMF